MRKDREGNGRTGNDERNVEGYERKGWNDVEGCRRMRKNKERGRLEDVEGCQRMGAECEKMWKEEAAWERMGKDVKGWGRNVGR